ncbi:MAG TPA: class I SAM-dependent methyltransferase, partial [Spirochaetota bacterium]|nr:class I SAM-dependent methyltransferase [Spirochaetota bacterium]
MEKWENKLGIAFFKKMGMVPGNIILDFGARIGHYTIPAARAVAERGAVYALDKDEAALAELEKKAAFSALSNIKVYKTSGDFSFNFKKNFFDYILLYDVLHFIKNSERKKLYKLLRPL